MQSSQRLKSLGFLICLWNCMNGILFIHGQSTQSLLELLSGYGKGSLTNGGESVLAETVYNAFPSCERQCNIQSPCQNIQANQQCTNRLSFLDSSMKAFSTSTNVFYCPHQTVCCFPGICRPRVLNCQFQYSTLMTRLQPLINTKALGVLNGLQALTTSTQNMITDLSESNLVNQQCTSNCNSWGSSNRGDVTTVDCPSSCQCTTVAPPRIIRGSRVCERVRRRNGMIIRTYHTGDRSLAESIGETTRTVCGENEICLDSNLCISYDEYVDLSFGISPDDSNPTFIDPTTDDGFGWDWTDTEDPSIWEDSFDPW